MAVKRKEHPWYSFDRLLSYNAVYNFCAGPRGTGKTYDAKKRSVRKSIKKGEQFIYLRRWKSELAAARRTFFSDFEHEFPDYDFRAFGPTAQMSPISERENKKREWIIIGYFIALSTAQTQKSVSFHQVTTIIFDEFVAEHGRQYLPDEANAFNNFFSTVDRNQDKTIVLFCANAVSIMNPYFMQYEIRPDKLPEYSASHNGFIACHFPDSADFKNSIYQTRFGKFIEGTDYAEYAVENRFEDANENLIDIKPSRARHMFNLETKYGMVAVWIDKPTGEYYVQRKLPKGDVMTLTLVPEKMSQGKTLVFWNDKLMSYLRAAFRNGLVTFDKPSTRNAFVEISKR